MMGLLKRHCTDKMHKYSLDIMSRMMIKQLSGESRSWPTEPGANSPPPAVVHNGNGLVKMLFAGAKAVHVAFAQEDIDGAKDHPLISRMPGFYIIEYIEKEFDSVPFRNKKVQEITVEGK